MSISVPPPSLRVVDEAMVSSIIEVMLLAAYSDGEFSPAERTHLERRLELLARGRFDAPTVARLRTEAADRIALEGRDARLLAVRTAFASPSERKVALALATRMIISDDIVRTSERDFLGDMAEALELDREEAADVVRALTR